MTPLKSFFHFFRLCYNNIIPSGNVIKLGAVGLIYIVTMDFNPLMDAKNQHKSPRFGQYQNLKIL